MISCEKARHIALQLPGTEEKDHWGRPSFRVRKKIYATLWPNEKRAVVRATLGDQTALVDWRPETFSVVPRWGNYGWTFVELTKVDESTFRDVLTAAWRTVVSKQVAADHGAAKPPKSLSRRTQRRS
jgi:hypothetical protein